MGWPGWVAIIGGVVAAAGQLSTLSGYYLPVIGGVIAIIAGIGEMMK